MKPYTGENIDLSLCWDQMDRNVPKGPDLIQDSIFSLRVVQKNMKKAQSTQKSYADNYRWPLQFNEGDKVYMKISPTKRVQRFGIKGKLSP